jgi:hypothetical protein
MSWRPLRALALDLWVAERPLRFLGMELGTRMTVLRLADGGLLLHSPVRLEPRLRAELDALGPVRTLVAPNRFHHLFVADYFAAYPDASGYAAPGLDQKRSDLRFHDVLDDEPPPLWAGQLDQLVFRAMPILNEVVFFHPATRTLIITDLVFNVQRAESLIDRVLLQLDGVYRRVALGRVERLFIRDKRAARASIDRMLAWDFDRLVLAHGDVLERGGRDALRAAFTWLR